MDSVVHFELPADDIDRAKKFYSEIFAWNLKSAKGMPYTMVLTTEIDPKTYGPAKPGAINGGMLQRQSVIQSPVITINVESIDEALKNIEVGGGKVLRGKTEVSTMGYSAYFEDTEGNVMGLWQTRKA